MKRQVMYARMVTASLARRRSRMLVAMLAITVGAMILSGLVTIYYDVPRQMGAQFRSYGANMILVPAGDADGLSRASIDAATSIVPADKLVGVAAYQYDSVRVNGTPVVVAGGDLDATRATSPYWYVDGEWPSASGEVLVGKEEAEFFSLSPGDTVTMTYTPEAAMATRDDDERGDAASTANAQRGDAEDGEVSSSVANDASTTATDAVSDTEATTDDGATDVTNDGTSDEDAVDGDAGEATVDRSADFTVSGILDTGGNEEQYLFVRADDLTALTQGDSLFDVAELSVSATSDELAAYAEAIDAAGLGVTAQLVKRVTESEATVLSKLQALVLLVTVIVLALTMICVATTMTAVITERRREIGLRKALGASNRSITLEFMGEGLLLGAVGGALGSLLGFLFAQGVSQSVFNSAISFQALLVPTTILAAVAVTALACLLPVRNATKVDPALVLKGE